MPIKKYISNEWNTRMYKNKQKVLLNQIMYKTFSRLRYIIKYSVLEMFVLYNCVIFISK